LDIRDEDDRVFKTDTERRTHITNFYCDLYKVPPPIPDQIQSKSIEEFLGDVANHPEVVASKISDEEKLILDRSLSIAELDLAVSKAKLNSAPGFDGISNRFIKDFWEFFRVPLHTYALCCLEKGELACNFRSSKIRLIPKKGDTSKIKNWRPISLLNCFYKIISPSIAERLKTVINKITNVGQKGYKLQILSRSFNFNYRRDTNCKCE
jgi:hypothetical protein